MAILSINEVTDMSFEAIQLTHENEIALINKIDKLATECVAGEADIEVLVEELEKYVKHVKEHFELEEELMEEYDFISYDLHKMAHDMFLADLMYATKHWKQNGDLNKIITFIRKSPEWLISHIETVDAPTAEYIAKKSAQA